jgi:hypothetical protein
MERDREGDRENEKKIEVPLRVCVHFVREFAGPHDRHRVCVCVCE